MAKDDGKDKRIHPRIDFFNHVKIVVPDTDTAIDVFAANVSRGGIFLRSNQPLPKGKTVKLRFETKKGPVEVDDGEVVWSKPFEPISIDGGQAGMGVRFRSLSEEAKNNIEAFIEEALIDSDAGAPDPPSPPPLPPPPKLHPAPAKVEPEAEATNKAETAPLPPPPVIPADLAFKAVEPEPSQPGRMALPIQASEAEHDVQPVPSAPRPVSIDSGAAVALPEVAQRNKTQAEVEMAVLSTPPPTKTRILVFAVFVGVVAVVTFLTLVWLKPFQDQRGEVDQRPTVVKTPVAKPAPTPEDKPAPTPEDKPAPTPEDKPAPTPEDKPAPTPEDKPAPTPEDKPAPTPEDKPEDPLTKAQGKHVATPQLLQSSDGWRLLIRASGPTQFKHFTLKAPPRLAIDALQADYRGKALSIPAQANFITKIRVGKQEGFTRFVLDFSEDQIPAHRIHTTEDSLTIVFSPK